MMQMMGDDADNNDGDNNAVDDADVVTDNNAVVQTMGNNADDKAREVKIVGGTLEAKMGRGGGRWGH